MPLEVPFSPSIVLAVVVVVDIVYMSSFATSHYLPSTLPGSENPLAAKRRAFYIRSAEFFHDIHLVLRHSFS